MNPRRAVTASSMPLRRPHTDVQMLPRWTRRVTDRHFAVHAGALRRCPMPGGRARLRSEPPRRGRRAPPRHRAPGPRLRLQQPTPSATAGEESPPRDSLVHFVLRWLATMCEGVCIKHRTIACIPTSVRGSLSFFSCNWAFSPAPLGVGTAVLNIVDSVLPHTVLRERNWTMLQI